MITEGDGFKMIAAAISFAARAHRHQFRKDQVTPYVAHPFRVCMVVRQVFGIDDPAVLAAAVLHDVLEDTTTDYDDLAEHFGTEVADIVAAMSKDMRLAEPVREPAYLKQLLDGNWKVTICKLADAYDNISDFAALTPAGRLKQLANTEHFLEARREGLPAEARIAFEIVRSKVVLLRESTGR